MCVCLSHDSEVQQCYLTFLFISLHRLQQQLQRHSYCDGLLFGVSFQLEAICTVLLFDCILFKFNNVLTHVDQ